MSVVESEQPMDMGDDVRVEATQSHESALRNVVQAFGHVLTEGARILVVPFVPYSHKAGESVANATSDRHVRVNPLTMETPASWGSSRRT